MNPLLTKAFTAEAPVAPRRIVKHGAGDRVVLQAAAADDAAFGVSGNVRSVAAGDVLDVHLAGVVEVDFGGAVTRGALLTADANGRAVVVAPAADTNDRVVGVAMESGANGDCGLILLTPGQVQGAGA